MGTPWDPPAKLVVAWLYACTTNHERILNLLSGWLYSTVIWYLTFSVCRPVLLRNSMAEGWVHSFEPIEMPTHASSLFLLNLKKDFTEKNVHQVTRRASVCFGLICPYRQIVDNLSDVHHFLSIQYMWPLKYCPVGWRCLDGSPSNWNSLQCRDVNVWKLAESWFEIHTAGKWRISFPSQVCGLPTLYSLNLRTGHTNCQT